MKARYIVLLVVALISVISILDIYINNHRSVDIMCPVRLKIGINNVKLSDSFKSVVSALDSDHINYTISETIGDDYNWQTITISPIDYFAKKSLFDGGYIEFHGERIFRIVYNKYFYDKESAKSYFEELIKLVAEEHSVPPIEKVPFKSVSFSTPIDKESLDISIMKNRRYDNFGQWQVRASYFYL